MRRILTGFMVALVMAALLVAMAAPAFAAKGVFVGGTGERGAPAAWRPAPEPTPTPLVVVEPGDSLWSISEEHIGPGATPEQIAYEVERIFELNRERIGENPNLIFPGQEFFLGSPAPVGAAAAVPEESVAVAEQQAPKPIVVESEGVSEGAVPASQTPDSTDEQVESAPAESVSTESTPAESTPATTADERGIAASLLEAYDTIKAERRLLGLGIIALTLIIAALMAWRLPMRRKAEDPAAWGIPQEYYENYAPPKAPTETSHEATKVPEGEPSGPASGAPPEEATPEPSVSSSATNGSSNGSPARGAEDAMVAAGGAAAADAAVDAAVDAADARAQERLRRVRHLRRIRQRRRSPSSWWGDGQ
jgi:LysM repeat protein